MGVRNIVQRCAYEGGVVREGRIAIVMGGGQGIGKAVSSHLLLLGYGAMLAEVDDEAG